jgi:hypothetical protein
MGKETPKRVGFMASYKGKTIAQEQSLGKLVQSPKVRGLLGKKELVIKHTVPEGMIAIY